MQKHCKRLKEFDQRDERKTQMLLLKLKINEPLLRHLNRTTHQIQLMNDIIIIIMVKKKQKKNMMNWWIQFPHLQQQQHWNRNQWNGHWFTLDDRQYDPIDTLTAVSKVRASTYGALMPFHQSSKMKSANWQPSIFFLYNTMLFTSRQKLTSFFSNRSSLTHHPATGDRFTHNFQVPALTKILSQLVAKANQIYVNSPKERKKWINTNFPIRKFFFFFFFFHKELWKSS